MKVLLICTGTSRAWACISEMVHQQTSDLQWMRVCGRQCVQGNGNTNALTPRVSVLISALSNSRLPHMSFTHTCQKAGSIQRGLSYRTSTPLLVFSQCSFCKPFLLKEALQKEGLSRSIGNVHHRPSMSLCCVGSQWRSRTKGVRCSWTGVACCRKEEKWMAKWGLIELCPVRGRDPREDWAFETGCRWYIHSGIFIRVMRPFIYVTYRVWLKWVWGREFGSFSYNGGWETEERTKWCSRESVIKESGIVSDI